MLSYHAYTCLMLTIDLVNIINWGPVFIVCKKIKPKSGLEIIKKIMLSSTQ